MVADPLDIPDFLKRTGGKMRPLETPVAPTIKAAPPKPVSGRDKTKMRDLGWADSDINAMTRREAEEIVATKRRPHKGETP